MVGIDESMSIKQKIHHLKKKEAHLKTIRPYRMKSKVQTYDLRDSEQYYGVLELEKLLKEDKEIDVEGLNNNIRKSYNKFLSQATIANMQNLERMSTKDLEKDQNEQFENKMLT